MTVPNTQSPAVDAEISSNLRKLAAALRQKAEKNQEHKAVKCAQILIAAQGLSQFQDILKGVK
jgi:uncharacterized protein (UPF0147 family)